MAASNNMVMKTSNIDSLAGFGEAKQIVGEFYSLVDAQNGGTRSRKIPFSLRQNQTEMLEKLQTFWTDMASRLLSYVNSELLLPVVQTDAMFIESAVHSFETQALGAVAPLGTLNLVEWRSKHSKTALNQYGLATKWEADRLGDPDGMQEYLVAMSQIIKSIRLFLEYDAFETAQSAGMPSTQVLLDMPDMEWYDEVMKQRDYFGQGNLSDTEMQAGFLQMQSDMEHRCPHKANIIFVPRNTRPLFGVRSRLATRHSEGGDKAVDRFLKGVLLDKIGEINVVEAPTVDLRLDGTGAKSMLRNYAQVGTYYVTNFQSRLSTTGNNVGATRSQMRRKLGIKIGSYDTRSMELVDFEDMVRNDPFFDAGTVPVAGDVHPFLDGGGAVKRLPDVYGAAFEPLAGPGGSSFEPAGVDGLRIPDPASVIQNRASQLALNNALAAAAAAADVAAAEAAARLNNPVTRVIYDDLEDLNVDNILKAVYDLGMIPPVEYILFRPYTGFHTANALIAHGGKNLGLTAVGNISYFLSQDNQAATASNGTRMRLASHIADETCVMTVRHFFSDKVVPNSNGSTKFFTKTKHDDFLNDGGTPMTPDDGKAALISCSFGITDKINPIGIIVDVTGFTGHGDDINANGRQGHYPTHAFYTKHAFQNLTHTDCIPLPSAMNRMCLPGYCEYSSNGDTFDIIVTGQGFDNGERYMQGNQARHLGSSFLE